MTLEESVSEMWDRGYPGPNTLILPLRNLIYLARPYFTRRGFRRWRARVRAQAKAARA